MQNLKRDSYTLTGYLVYSNASIKKKQLNVNKQIENREKRKIVNEGGNGGQTFREVHRNKLIASIWVVLVGGNMIVIYFTCFHIPTTSIKCPLEKPFSQKGRYE